MPLQIGFVVLSLLTLSLRSILSAAAGRRLGASLSFYFLSTVDLQIS
jgi:hypothetical protein